MIPTPRTDAKVKTHREPDSRESFAYVCPDDCREIERALIAAEDRIRELLQDRDILAQDCERWITHAKRERQQRDTLAAAMQRMWPFIEEDDYPACNTPEFANAIQTYKSALSSIEPQSPTA